jgi:hypothetical protein
MVELELAKPFSENGCHLVGSCCLCCVDAKMLLQERAQLASELARIRLLHEELSKPCTAEEVLDLDKFDFLVKEIQYSLLHLENKIRDNEMEIDYCAKCVQITNHTKEKCLKCEASKNGD